MESVSDKSLIKEVQGILLWDIDGTLVRKKDTKVPSIHLRALRLEISTVDNSDMSGLSDWDVLTKYGSQKCSLEEIKKAFYRLDELFQVEDATNFEEFFGVRELLKSTSTRGWVNCVLTGNTPKRAILKLKIANLYEYFDEKLIFGCNLGESRSDIAFRAKLALMRKDVIKIVIGDTKQDIKVAKKHGFIIIAVASGNETKNELKKLHPDILLENLNIDPDSFLEKLKQLSIS